MKDRKLTFEKIHNARDLGGLQTKEGRIIKEGLLIRSANLSEATEADLEKMKEVHCLAKVIDLRTSKEKTEKPDIYSENTEYIHNPIFDERVFGISHERENDEKLSKPQIPVMEDLYCMMVTNESCRANLGKAVRAVMEHDFSKGSVLWHCTEGKDRCGLVTAMVLGALGVKRELIMEDYLLTNEVNAPKAEMFYQRVFMAGKSEVEAEAVKNAFLAKESYLNAAFSVIDEKYPDMETYLKEGLGIPEESILAFRKAVLE